MKLLILFSICLATALAVPKNPPIATLRDVQDRIIGGSDAVKGQIPWQVALQGFQSGGSWFCGGSLISDQWVLTAAHCAVGANRFILWFGGLTSSNTEDGRLTVESTTYIVHSGYNDYLNNDVALIKLPEPIEFSDFISPVRLPNKGETITDGIVVQISGWGKTSDNASGVSSTLKYVEVTTITNSRCALVYGSQTIISSTLCAVGNPNHSTCSGDSGGPLVRFSADGTATHHGIVSFVHINGCASGNPSGYVRTESMLNWIKQNTGLNI